MTKDYYEWCKRKAQEISKHNSEDTPSPPPPPPPLLPAAYVLYEDTECFVVMIRNQRYLIKKGEHQK